MKPPVRLQMHVMFKLRPCGAFAALFYFIYLFFFFIICLFIYLFIFCLLHLLHIDVDGCTCIILGVLPMVYSLLARNPDYSSISMQLESSSYVRSIRSPLSFFHKSNVNLRCKESKKISNDQELIQSDPISCSQNQKGNN